MESIPANCSQQSLVNQQAILNSLADAVVLVDENGKLVASNTLADELLEIGQPEMTDQLLAERYGFHTSFYTTAELSSKTPIARALAGETVDQIEVFIRRARGTKGVWLGISVRPVRDEDERIRGALATFRDLSPQKANEERLRDENLLLEEVQLIHQAVLRSTPHGLCILAPDWRVTWANRAMTKIFIDAQRSMTGELAGMALKNLFPSEAKFDHYMKLALISMRSTGSDMREVELQRTDGSPIWCEISIVRLDPKETLSGYVATISDNSERKWVEDKLQHDSLHDALTGLPNRTLFNDHLRLAIARAIRSEASMFALLLLDLDGFKFVNDSLGHTNGDELLFSIGRRLQSLLRPGDTLARLGGDEFVFLLDGIPTESDATEFADRIHREIALPFTLKDQRVFTSASIGIALRSPTTELPDDYLRNADTAMNRAKSNGKGRHEIFETTMHASVVGRLRTEADLRQAVEKRQFELRYQPIVCLRTGSLTGFEALIRWNHPERGLLLPSEFIPVAEETGMIVQIGKWVLQEASQQVTDWHTRFPSGLPFSISVNLSIKHFSDPDLISQMEQILAIMGDPSRLRLELTESAFMPDDTEAAEILAKLREMKVQLYLDDFGTGHSSLSRLHRFPMDTLKIDRSFISKEGADGLENIEIIRTILMLAQNLKLDVIAEGIETATQRDQLAALGCKYGQGFLFAQPLTSSAATAIIESKHHW